MKCSNSDPCLFIRTNNEKKIFVVIYVEYGLVSGTDESEIELFVTKMKDEFQGATGPLDSFLGMNIKWLQDSSVFLVQSAYTRKILSLFRMADSNGKSTPPEKVTQMRMTIQLMKMCPVVKLSEV